jgi:hypothetical protein
MSKKNKNQSQMNNSSQTLNQKPFDVLMNEHFGTYQNNGTSNNWFIPIVKEQSMMDKILEIQTSETDPYDVNWEMKRILPNTLLECNKDENGNITSIYVLFKKGGKIFRVVSHKNYGIIKSRMELKNNKYVPYEKCDLVPYTGTIHEYKNDKLFKSYCYKDGLKDGECFTYFQNNRLVYDLDFEKITYKNGKKNGEYLNKQTMVQGYYINDKKIGEWRIKGKQLINEIQSSYQYKFDLSDHDVENFVYLQKPFFINPNFNYQVYYVNDILNGSFEIEGWKGEFNLGLFNGQICKESNFYDSTKKHIVNYSDGCKNGIEICYSYEKNFETKSKIEISNYLNGNKITSTKFSKNENGNTPQILTDMTKKYLNVEVFDTLINNNMNIEDYTVDDFLNEWIVMEYVELDDKNSIVYNINIEKKELKYSLGHFDFNKYVVEECGYPYYTKNTYLSRTTYSLLKSNEFRSYHDYLPKVFSISEFGKPNKILINGKLIFEIIEDEINPEVLNYQKTIYQQYSNLMKKTYEDELLQKEIDGKVKQVEEQKKREEQGISLNSFPID